MQTTKLFELLAVAVAFASADYEASAETSDSIDTSKLVPADTSSVSSTADAIQSDKIRSLRTVDATAARIDEERGASSTAAAGIANGKAAAETVLVATARKLLADALSTKALAVRKPALGTKKNVNKPASRTRAEKVSSPASLTQAAGIAKRKAAAETVYEATVSKLLSEYLLTKVRKTDPGLKSFKNVKKAPKKGKDGTPAYQMYWPRKVEILVVILPHLESGQPLSTILEDFPHVSEQHFIQGVAEFMEETNVPEMKRNIQHRLNQDHNEIEILFLFQPSLEKVEDIKYSVIVYYTRLLSHEKVRKMVFDLLDRGLSQEEMLLEMQKAEGGAFLSGAEKRLERFYKEWSFANEKAK